MASSSCASFRSFGLSAISLAFRSTTFSILSKNEIVNTRFSGEMTRIKLSTLASNYF